MGDLYTFDLEIATDVRLGHVHCFDVDFDDVFLLF